MPLPRITELLNLLNVNEFNRCLLSAYYVLDTVSTAEDSTIQSKQDMIPALKDLPVWWVDDSKLAMQGDGCSHKESGRAVKDA